MEPTLTLLATSVFGIIVIWLILDIKGEKKTTHKWNGASLQMVVCQALVYNRLAVIRRSVGGSPDVRTRTRRWTEAGFHQCCVWLEFIWVFLFQLWAWALLISWVRLIGGQHWMQRAFFLLFLFFFFFLLQPTHWLRVSPTCLPRPYWHRCWSKQTLLNDTNLSMRSHRTRC